MGFGAEALSEKYPALIVCHMRIDIASHGPSAARPRYAAFVGSHLMRDAPEREPVSKARTFLCAP